MKHHRGILRLRCSVCGRKKASKFPRTFQIDVWPYHRGHREHKLSGLAAGDVNAGGQAQSGVKQKSAVWGDLWDNGTAFSQIKHEVYLETLNCTLLPFEGVSQYTEKEEKSDLMLLSCFDCARDNQRKIEGNCPFVLMPTVRIDKELVDGKLLSSLSFKMFEWGLCLLVVDNDHGSKCNIGHWVFVGSSYKWHNHQIKICLKNVALTFVPVL
jgi:hypothetical protein